MCNNINATMVVQISIEWVTRPNKSQGNFSNKHILFSVMMNFRYKRSERLNIVRGILTKRKQAPPSDSVFKSIDYLSISLVYKSRTLTKQEEEQEYLV